MDFYVAYDYSIEEFECSFFTIVIKNRACREKGFNLSEFALKYHARSNAFITVTCTMGSSEIDYQLDDLISDGLKPGEDFVAFDFWKYATNKSNGGSKKLEPHEIDMGVDWLRCEYRKDGFYVWYEEVEEKG